MSIGWTGRLFYAGLAGYLGTCAMKGYHNGKMIAAMRQDGFDKSTIDMVVRHANRHFDGLISSAYTDLCNRGLI